MMMDTFTQDWTYRDPMTTVQFKAGQSLALPDHIQLAARKARVLVPPTMENDDGNDGSAAKARTPRRSRSAQE